MQRKLVNQNTRELKILGAMIVNDNYLAHVAAKWTGNMLSCKESNIIANLAVQFYRDHNEAPKKGINALFDKWAEAKDENTSELVGKTLSSINERWERLNEFHVEHFLSVTSEYFDRVDIERRVKEVGSLLEAGQIKEAALCLETFKRNGMKEDSGVDLFHDSMSVWDCFSEENLEPVVRYPAPLDEFFHGMLVKDSLIAFIAPEKAGKSYMLTDLAYRAMIQRKRVAFFEVGDMSKNQIGRRFLARNAAHPYTSKGGKWPCEVKKPTRIIAPSEESVVAQVEFDTLKFDRPLDYKIAWSKARATLQERVKMNVSNFRLYNYPNSSINVKGIEAELISLRNKDWLPDLVVIDYADILAPPAGKMEVRDQINTTWKQLRSLSQAFKCLVVTATQADADSYEKKTITKRNFSEDKRKLSHVNGLCGINVTAEEKNIGVSRLNWVVTRESAHTWKQCIHVAGCLPLCNPVVCAAIAD